MEVTPTPDLDKLRDEKCIPIATEIIKDLAIDMIPEDANISADYSPIAVKVMQKFLDADTNIATDNSYVFQLILGAFAGLNATIQQTECLPVDNVKYGRITKQVLDILVNSGINFGPTAPDKALEKYSVLLPELNKLFTEEKLNAMEVKYITEVLFESFQTVQTLVNTSIERSTKKAEEKLFSVEDMSDLTMKKVDDILKN